MKHTPAPWTISGNTIHNKPTEYDPVSGARIGETALRICSVDIQPNGGEREANARLIAAAPELLNTLEALTSAFAWYNDNSRIKANAPERERIENNIRWARAAIDKAKGE